jgi:hypothetical protein
VLHKARGEKDINVEYSISHPFYSAQMSSSNWMCKSRGSFTGIQFTHFKDKEARHQWLMPVILATQEAEIRRIVGLKAAWANCLQHPISKKPITKMGWWSGSR